jgi:hypothetical protein
MTNENCYTKTSTTTLGDADTNSANRDAVTIVENEERQQAIGVGRSQPESIVEQVTMSTPVVDWTCKEDMDNPHNWSLTSRVYHVVVPGLFGFAVLVFQSVLLQHYRTDQCQYLWHLCLHPRPPRCNRYVFHLPNHSYTGSHSIHPWPRFRTHVIGAILRALWS